MERNLSKWGGYFFAFCHVKVCFITPKENIKVGYEMNGRGSVFRLLCTNNK